ncbi:MAG: amylo-alpha-1,6-glucosidase [Clostridia bacterium]
MKFTKENLDLETGLTKEWLITNGIGGFASSTIIGANTRKYHGLLIAPLKPPASRYLILSKLDESIESNGKKYDLYTNVCENYISQGYKYLEEFEKDIYPTYKYKIPGMEIEKSIVMEYGENTVGVYYKIRNGKFKAKLTLAPIVNFRDFHTMSTNHNFDIRQQVNEDEKVKLIVDNNSQVPIYMCTSEGKYIKHENDTFKNMFYIEEEKRGFYPEENHAVPGIFEIEIKPNEEKEVSFICSMEENIEEKDAKYLMEKETSRINEFIESTQLIEKKEKKTKKDLEKEELIKTYIKAIDNFIVYRPNFRLHTIIAGYPWFLDWGRDTLISFEGLLLCTKQYGLAKEVLMTMVKDTKYGLVPNGYSGYDNRPLYNSVDASLLLFEQVHKYLEYTKDYKFIREKIYPKMESIIDNYVSGNNVDGNNIYLDKDGLIVSGTGETQNTWMDAKVGNVAITPRNGKAVEINAMWYNANMIMANLTLVMGDLLKIKKYKDLAKKCKKAFKTKFYNPKTKCLDDVIGDDRIRPNQLFALSLTHQVIEADSEIAENIINIVEKKLLNNYGLKTLAKGEPDYIEIYEGDGAHRDASYHQGITWPWLLGLYYNSLINIKNKTKEKEEKEEIEQKIKKFKDKVNKTFKKEILENGCIGSIAEIYDSTKPQLPKGAIAQAWSIAEIFRIIRD